MQHLPNISTKIRPFAPQDAPQVVKMVRALAAFHGDEATATISALVRDAGAWMDVLVAEHAQRLVGYAVLLPLAQVQFGVRGMDLHHLYVEDAMRGCGVGSALIAAAKETAKSREARYLAVGTHPDNHAAQAVYLAAGFARRDAAGPRFTLRL